MPNIYIPYTYLIGWTKLDRWYYGVRYAEGCKPEDLWKSYFTSSQYVKDFIKLNGNPDVLEIRKTFDNSKSARLWENKVLKRLKVVNNEKWLNKTDNISCEITENTRISSRENIKKAIQSNIGRKYSEETLNKRSQSLLKFYQNNKPPLKSEETKKLLSEKLKGLKRSEETKQKMRKPKSEEHKRKISEARTGIKYKQKKPRSIEYRNKISERLRGKPKSEETKQKMRAIALSQHDIRSKNAKGNKSRTGKLHSEETKQKMAEARKKYWENKIRESRMD